MVSPSRGGSCGGMLVLMDEIPGAVLYLRQQHYLTLEIVHDLSRRGLKCARLSPN